MLLQPKIHCNPHHVSLSPPAPPSLSHSTSLLSYGFSNVRTITRKKPQPFITCSLSQTPRFLLPEQVLKWSRIYKEITLTNTAQPDGSSVVALDQWESEGKNLGKWELYRVIKELRKFGRYKSALEVFDWMNERPDKYRVTTTSDIAVQLDLIAKVRGIQSAEHYFQNLPSLSKDKRVYGSLLNVYSRASMREKSESLMAEMKSKNYFTHALPFNVMMTLYMNLKDYNKVESIANEMIEEQIPLDEYTYNIWLSSCGSSGLIEKMEQVFEKMKLDRTVKPTWTTYSSMATIYIRINDLDKAEDCLRRLESQIKGRDRMAFHCLISLYGIAGNKQEVHRVWNTYKSIFPYIPNMGYIYIISALVRLDDIEGAEQIYDEWLLVKSTFDSRMVNLLMGWYIRNGFFRKAEACFEGIKKAGGKPDSKTWEILAGGLRERRLTEALTCFKEALSAPGSKNWSPDPLKVNLILELCEQENDSENNKVLFEILRQAGCLEDDKYMSSISLSDDKNGENVS